MIVYLLSSQVILNRNIWILPFVNELTTFGQAARTAQVRVTLPPHCLHSLFVYNSPLHAKKCDTLELFN